MTCTEMSVIIEHCTGHLVINFMLLQTTSLLKGSNCMHFCDYVHRKHVKVTLNDILSSKNNPHTSTTYWPCHLFFVILFVLFLLPPCGVFCELFNISFSPQLLFVWNEKRSTRELQSCALLYVPCTVHGP